MIYESSIYIGYQSLEHGNYVLLFEPQLAHQGSQGINKQCGIAVRHSARTRITG